MVQQGCQFGRKVGLLLAAINSQKFGFGSWHLATFWITVDHFGPQMRREIGRLWATFRQCLAWLEKNLATLWSRYTGILRAPICCSFTNEKRHDFRYKSSHRRCTAANNVSTETRVFIIIYYNIFIWWERGLQYNTIQICIKKPRETASLIQCTKTIQKCQSTNGILPNNAITRNTLDCDQSNYSSHIPFSHIGLPVEFGQSGNSAIRSADLENPTLKPNMKWIRRSLTEVWPFEIFPNERLVGRWSVSPQYDDTSSYTDLVYSSLLC